MFGSHREPLAAKPLVGHEIDIHTPQLVEKGFLHNQVETVFILNSILIRWLIQSQAQTGPASAMARDVDPNCFVLFLFFYDPDYLLPGSFRHFKHLSSFDTRCRKQADSFT